MAHPCLYGMLPSWVGSRSDVRICRIVGADAGDDDLYSHGALVSERSTADWSCSCVSADRHLTAREVDVVLCIASELSNSEIARKLGVSVRTVETHLTRLLRKSGARSRSGLVTRCYAAGMLVPGKMPPEYSGRVCLTI